ncbi:MAG: DUF262 domain-containing protein [Bacteroidales bacterium]|nr:DUF262 domain-containing protein [Bacteroidales bacterium]
MELNEYTFQSLFGKHQTKEGVDFEIKEIEIPIIQRDYAQGRQTDKVIRVRNRFLSTIYEALTTPKKLTLDFVYGEIRDNKLIPLDGQQRLTTLFLLHWYLAKKEKVSDEDSDFMKHFSYYTRPSSRDFCKALVEYSPTFENKISENIKDQCWFQYQWHNDPTISSMLVMIDAIDEKFKNTNDLWDVLINGQYITFYFLPISEMGITDELYIKMNSRGKPLTDFEHFKAEFEGMISKCNENLSKEINRKFDLDWTDMLFPYRGEKNIIDDEFMRYYFFVSDILCYKKDYPIERNEFKLAKMLYGEGNPDAMENLDYFKKSLDCWCGFDIDVFFKKHFSNNQYETSKTKIYQENLNIFKQCCNDYGEYVDGRRRKFPLSMTLLLYAVIVYLQNKNSIGEDDFQRRIRIVRNLIWNSSDEIRADSQRNNMPQLLSETKEIIEKGIIPQGTGYNQRQKEEEQNKLDWLKTNADKQDSLFHLEDHSLLYGCVAIEGIDNPSNFDKFRMLFDKYDDDYRCLLISKCMLTIGDYSQWIGSHWQIGTKNNSTWKDLFHPSNQRGEFNRTKDVLNRLLDSSTRFDNESLESIVDKYLASNPIKDWRYYFIKYCEFMHSTTYGLYYTYDDGDYHSIKLHAKQKNGRTWNVFLLTIYNELKDDYDISLGEYAYQGDKLHLPNNIELDCENDKFVLYKNGERETEYKIEQDDNGIDKYDRIEQAKGIISSLME